MNNRLREWRKEHDLRLEDVSDLTGYSVAMLSRAERGERTFSPMAKVQIARALDVRVRDLFQVDACDEEVVAVPAKSEKQRRFIFARFGSAWAHAHHFANKGKLPKRAKRKKGS